MNTLSEKLKLLPGEPGVYLLRDAFGQVIYVGKASSLRNRVRSYFQAARHLDLKTRILVQEIADFEYIVTPSEHEALILEDTLIKRYRPRYNVRLRDDKRYPYLKISKERFPRLMSVRRIGEDGARYFGPYTDSQAMREAVKTVQRLFRIRTCTLDIRDKPVRQRPCLDHYLRLCDAPCVGGIDEASYRALVEEAALFLKGQHGDLLPKLWKEMQEASKNLEFERAARLRDQIQVLEHLLSTQKVAEPKGVDQDAIGLAQKGDACHVQVFFIRGGELIGREHFPMEAAGSTNPQEILTAFVKQYYSNAFVPKEILVPYEPQEPRLLESWLSELRGSRVHMVVPRRGRKAHLIKMVQRNAELALQEEQVRNLKTPSEQAVYELAKLFHLEEPPRRIEGFDVSNIQGRESTGSMVVFEDGAPKKSNYRRFRIKYTEGPDDFAMMAEVVCRRLEHALSGDERFLPLPNLMLLDGGKGQLSAVRRIMRELGLEKIPTIALAKEFEHIFVEGKSSPIILPRNSPALKLLQRIRDEAHRFALAYHRTLRQKRTVKSLLDDVPGLGPKRKRLLLQHFGSIKRLKGASLEDLTATGLPKELAKRLYALFHRD